MDYFETEGGYEVRSITAPATDSARQWSGWGTALKPAWEPIIVARKPLVGTVAANVTRYGTGALNIDGCRLPIEGVAGVWGAKQAASIGFHGGTAGSGFATVQNPQGRWPANVMHDGSDEVLAGFPGDEARFFYCPKASNADREEGNTHPTVKPTDLMRYLCRLVTPTDGLVLDPFMGSGSTGKGALLEGFRFVGIDLDPAHVAIAEARCQFAVETVESECAQLTLF
jgi:site-specific DNA-methyltransferase (adenine-specific)